MSQLESATRDLMAEIQKARDRYDPSLPRLELVEKNIQYLICTGDALLPWYPEDPVLLRIQVVPDHRAAGAIFTPSGTVPIANVLGPFGGREVVDAQSPAGVGTHRPAIKQRLAALRAANPTGSAQTLPAPRQKPADSFNLVT